MQLHYVKHSWSGPRGADCVIVDVCATHALAEAAARTVRRTLREDDDGRPNPIHDRVDVGAVELVDIDIDADDAEVPAKIWWLEKWEDGVRTIYADEFFATRAGAREARRERRGNTSVASAKVIKEPVAAYLGDNDEG